MLVKLLPTTHFIHTSNPIYTYDYLLFTPIIIYIGHITYLDYYKIIKVKAFIIKESKWISK